MLSRFLRLPDQAGTMVAKSLGPSGILLMCAPCSGHSTQDSPILTQKPFYQEQA